MAKYSNINEDEVIAYLKQGKSRAEIAEILGISVVSLGHFMSYKAISLKRYGIYQDNYTVKLNKNAASIVQDLLDGGVISELAKKYGVSYGSFTYWQSSNGFQLYGLETTPQKDIFDKCRKLMLDPYSKSERVDVVKLKPKPKGTSLTELQKEAQAHGLSYGQYVARYGR